MAALKPPLSLFNATTFSRDQIFKLINSINEEMKSAAIEQDIIRQYFETYFPSFEESVLNAVNAYGMRDRLQPSVIFSPAVDKEIACLQKEAFDNAKSVYEETIERINDGILDIKKDTMADAATEYMLHFLRLIEKNTTTEEVTVFARLTKPENINKSYIWPKRLKDRYKAAAISKKIKLSYILYFERKGDISSFSPLLFGPV
ncbi:MAG: hypothetical protein ACXWUF_18640 [Methylomagnum sp.]